MFKIRIRDIINTANDFEPWPVGYVYLLTILILLVIWIIALFFEEIVGTISGIIKRIKNKKAT